MDDKNFPFWRGKKRVRNGFRFFFQQTQIEWTKQKGEGQFSDKREKTLCTICNIDQQEYSKKNVSVPWGKTKDQRLS